MKTLIFPGWASFESFYKKELLEDFFYFDNDDIKIDEEVNIIAWSMGTLRALEYIKGKVVNKLVLIAPTTDFMATMELKYLESMIVGIKQNKIQTLKEFYRLNFIKNSDFLNFVEEFEKEIKNMEEKELIRGLEYLRDTKIELVDFNNVKKVLIIRGKKDKIIPKNNSQNIIRDNPKAEVIEYNLGHNLIYKNNHLKELVRSFLID